MHRLLASVVFGLAFVGAAAAANNYWKGADGAALGDETNWDLGLPTAVNGCFKAVPSSDYRVTLNDDLTLYGLQTGAQNVRTTFDLGGYTLNLTSTASGGTVRFDQNGATMVFTNGTLTVPGSGQCRIVQNSATVVIGRGAEVTMKANIQGAQDGKTGNEVRVEDGGVFNGYVSFGEKTSRNQFTVTGADTRYEFQPNVANKNTFSLSRTNSVLISAGAMTTNACSLFVGSNGSDHFGENFFCVTGEGTSHEQLEALVVGGWEGSDSNRFEVLDGAYVHLTGGNHGLGCNPSQSGSFTGGVGNEILVSGEGSKLFQDGTSQYLRLGRMSVSGDNRLVLADGAEADIRCLDVNGIGNEVVLSNGMLTIQRLFEWTSDTHEAAANDSATLRFQGPKAKLFFEGGASDPALSNTCFAVSVPETGFENTLISTKSGKGGANVNILEGCTFAFEGLLPFVRAGGTTITLVEVGASNRTLTVDDAVLAQIKEAAEASANGLVKATVEVVNKKLVLSVKEKKGLILLLK